MLWDIATALPSRPAFRALAIVVPKAAEPSNKDAAQVDVQIITATQSFAYACERTAPAGAEGPQQQRSGAEAATAVKVQAGLGYFITDTCGRDEAGADAGTFLPISASMTPTLTYKHLADDL